MEKKLEKRESILKGKLKTVILFLIFIILVLFYLSLPKKEKVKEVEFKSNIRIAKEEKYKDMEEILKESLNKLLKQSSYQDVEITKIYFSNSVAYLEANKKAIEENQEMKEKILKMIQEKFSITEIKFL